MGKTGLLGAGTTSGQSRDQSLHRRGCHGQVGGLALVRIGTAYFDRLALGKKGGECDPWVHPESRPLNYAPSITPGGSNASDLQLELERTSMSLLLPLPKCGRWPDLPQSTCTVTCTCADCDCEEEMSV